MLGKLAIFVFLALGGHCQIEETELTYECRLKSKPTPLVNDTINVGRPGKRGPIGPIGMKGQKGESGTISNERISNAIIVQLTQSRPTECPKYGVDGVIRIYPRPFHEEGVRVYCDASTDGGGWIVLQRREDGSTNFYRTFKEYVHGFGSKNGEFWIGLDTIYRLTNADAYELYIDVGDFDGRFAWAKYSTFKIGDGRSMYALTIGGYSGTATRDPMAHHNGRRFSAKDLDNDDWGDNCAVTFKGGWWYGNCIDACLNGLYLPGGVVDAKGIVWEFWKNSYYSMKFSEIKIRKIAQ